MSYDMSYDNVCKSGSRKGTQSVRKGFNFCFLYRDKSKAKGGRNLAGIPGLKFGNSYIGNVQTLV